MLQKSKSKSNASASGLSTEYRYASHHHLIPLYALSGVAILALLVLGCFIGVLWQSSQNESYRPAAASTVSTIESLYLPTAISPTEKKQYVYSANVRFPANNPYDTLRYAYDPGIAATSTSSTITITTTRTLQTMETAVLQHPEKINEYDSRFQQCARLYVIRFVAGVTPYGGLTPLKDVKLKDGRTAYIHKNSTCVPDSVQAMNQLDNTEKDILAIESF
jgi:hypothetical protein